MSEDFPTFDLPIKAYSGSSDEGHVSTDELLMTKVEDLISKKFVLVDKSV